MNIHDISAKPLLTRPNDPKVFVTPRDAVITSYRESLPFYQFRARGCADFLISCLLSENPSMHTRRSRTTRQTDRLNTTPTDVVRITWECVLRYARRM